jgi:ABC-type multidrug transport system ATPase subunit
MQNIIEVKELSKNFGQFKAVQNLSFSVPKGSVYGFLGQNGAGKSTTLRMLLSLIKPNAGSIQIAGYNLSTHRKHVLQNIGAVIEKPDTYKYLSAYTNLQLFARLSGIKPTHSQLMSQLELVGLAERATDKVKTFSQGMKQRLGIAIALVHNPQLIILDEPTNGLDPQGIADIRNLILQLSKQMDKTVVVSSHLLSEIEQIATHVLIIDKGQKLVEDAATTLFNPAETLVSITTLNHAVALKAIQQSHWANCVQPHPTELVIKLHHNQIPQLHQELVSLQIPLISLQPRHKLEDYFLNITSGKQHVNPL